LNWRVWTLLATLAWALWGIGVKFALKQVNWSRLEVLSALAGMALMALIAPSAFRVRPTNGDAMGLLTGALGAAGAILFYIAVSKGPVSVVIPVTSLYVVGVAAAGLILFGEPVTWRKIGGIVLATAAIILLAGEE
jgi:bacterial/archaeal transporter family protein